MHPWLKKAPHRRIGPRQIDVAAPEPVAAFGILARLDERRRLRIVNHDKTPVQQNAVAIHPVQLAKGLKPALASHVRPTVQRIVERFGDVEEIAIALHHVPPGIQPKLPHQRENPRQQLRHPATHGRGIHHIHGRPFQRLRQRP